MQGFFVAAHWENRIRDDAYIVPKNHIYKYRATKVRLKISQLCYKAKADLRGRGENRLKE